MKLSQRWLAEMLDAEFDLDHVLERLTLAGLEVDGFENLEAVDGVVIGRIVAIRQHPDADKLKVCDVDDGQQTLSIVCGAPNARANMTVAVARIGSKLPGGLKIRRSKLRGVESHGMLCSAAELGLGVDHDGILDLPGNLEPGISLAEALGLPDAVIDIDLTPNRGDCFSVLGVAREIATFEGLAFKEPIVAAVKVTSDVTLTPIVAVPQAVPVFSASAVRGIDANARTPLWIVEKLRRSGIRAIHPVVDITNLVMLEFGQPMHGYDLDKVSGELHVRYADGVESIKLLDGKSVQPDKDTLVIADDGGAIGLAGVMGGESTMVDETTTNVLFEAAHFTPAAMAGQARRYGMHTDASLRFERGVDAYGHERAQARAVSLLVEMAGGHSGPLSVQRDEQHLSARLPVLLRAERLAKMLGVVVDPQEVISIFKSLGFEVNSKSNGWEVVAPTWRFDIAIEEDLIEEIARVYGYDRIPVVESYARAVLAPSPEGRVSDDHIRDALVARGFSEAVTYSFVDPERHAALDIAPAGPALLNPISKDLSVMRGTLLCGLLDAARYNLARQQSRVQFFEVGRVFTADAEPEKLAGLMAGNRTHEQWAESEREVDFFDIKSELTAILALAGADSEWRFEPLEMDALHPGQSAVILRNGENVGFIGALHPAMAARLDIDVACMVFEIDVSAAFVAKIAVSEAISRYPQVRRDIAVLVDESLFVEDLRQTAFIAAGEILKDVIVFDIYQGKGVEPGRKSIALGLILLDSSRTLTDEVSENAVATIVTALHQSHGAKLRE